MIIIHEDFPKQREIRLGSFSLFQSLAFFLYKLEEMKETDNETKPDGRDNLKDGFNTTTTHHTRSQPKAQK
jgi:hypothetical protein